MPPSLLELLQKGMPMHAEMNMHLELIMKKCRQCFRLQIPILQLPGFLDSRAPQSHSTGRRKAASKKDSSSVDVKHLTSSVRFDKKGGYPCCGRYFFPGYPTEEEGEVLGLIGESGSGKSTVARCLMNIYQPQSDLGKFYIMGLIFMIKKNFRKIKKCCRPKGQ